MLFRAQLRKADMRRLDQVAMPTRPGAHDRTFLYTMNGIYYLRYYSITDENITNPCRELHFPCISNILNMDQKNHTNPTPSLRSIQHPTMHLPKMRLQIPPLHKPPPTPAHPTLHRLPTMQSRMPIRMPILAKRPLAPQQLPKPTPVFPLHLLQLAFETVV